MKVLVTGGAGFVGSHLARKLVARGHEVVVFDNFAASLPQSMQGLVGRVVVVSGDILDLSHLIRTCQEHGIQRVVHTAAIVGVPVSLERPLYTVKVNIEGSLNVFEAARLLHLERVVDVSSEESYGVFQAEVANEDHPQNPVSPYGVTKVAVERLADQYSRHFGLQYAAVRLCWVYGPGYPRQRIPGTWIEDALNGRRTVMATGGDHRIDFTYIDDAVEGLRLVLEASHLEQRAYNVATGRALTLREVAAELKRVLPDWEYEIGPGLLEQWPGYVAPQKGALDIRRISDELRYRPRYDLATGLPLYVESLRGEHGGKQ